MPAHKLTKSAMLMLILVIVSLLSWELFLRNKGFTISYNDDEALWLNKRDQVYAPADKTTVIIGSSRIKFDLDIPTWEKESGDKAIQLAIEGSNPMMALENLGDDEKFKGKLIIDVTEGLFFSPFPDRELPKRLKYIKEVTPAQRVSAQLGFGLEAGFVFLDKENFSLGALLPQLPIPPRNAVFNMPIFPAEFETTSFQRQAIMTDAFIKDTSLQNKVKGIWGIYGALNKQHGVTGDTLQKIFTTVQTAVAKIKARGGKVIFTRTPSSGDYLQFELVNFPRADYYDKLLSLTGSAGIYFSDYPELKNLTCPEWSHLAPSDAVIYTHSLVNILQQQHWFAHNN